MIHREIKSLLDLWAKNNSIGFRHLITHLCLNAGVALPRHSISILALPDLYIETYLKNRHDTSSQEEPRSQEGNSSLLERVNELESAN